MVYAVNMEHHAELVSKQERPAHKKFEPFLPLDKGKKNRREPLKPKLGHRAPKKS